MILHCHKLSARGHDLSRGSTKSKFMENYFLIAEYNSYITLCYNYTNYNKLIKNILVRLMYFLMFLRKRIYIVDQTIASSAGMSIGGELWFKKTSY